MTEKEPVIQYLDGVSFRLAAPFDFAFLHDFGRVFQVYDDQDSGNICFGIDDGNQRVCSSNSPVRRPFVAMENRKTR